MNFRFSPLGLLIGGISVDLDFKVAPDWTIGPALSYYHLRLTSTGDFESDFDVTGYAVGARANWFHNGTFTDGLYVGPSVGYATFKVTSSDSAGDASATASGARAGCLVGYAWFWDSFNIMLGGGFDVSLGDSKLVVKSRSGTQEEIHYASGGLDGEFSLGWTF
jgi:hypothetical protein